MRMKKYYDFHERAYQDIKNQGYISWDKSKKFSEIMAKETQIFLDKIVSEYFNQKLELGAMKALDLGCGTGTTSFYFSEKKFEVTGVDISKTAIEIANKLAKENGFSIDFKIHDILNLSLLNEKFDLIYDSHCLHCIVFDEERAQALNEIKTCMNKNSIFILDTMAFSEKMSLINPPNSFLRFDENYILWHQANDLNIQGTTSSEGKNWCAQRRIKPAVKIIDEVKLAGFQIIASDLIQQKNEEPQMLRMVLKANEQ